MNENYVISFSGGRSSAFMTLELLKDEKYQNAKIIFSNTGKENEQTLDFVNKVDQYIGGKIIWLEYDPVEKYKIVSYETASRNGEPFEALINKRKFCPNRVMRFCTVELKIKVMKKYCKNQLKWKNWTNLVGIRYDEPRRWNKSKSIERKEIFDVEHPLVKWKVTKQDVINYWNQMSFNLNLKEYEGNCDLCFLKGKKIKQMIAREHPERYDWWISMEEKINGRFVSEYSYKDLMKWVINQPAFDFDDSIECFCNID